MPHLYQAPEHISAVFAPSGELRANDKGVIELPDDAPDADHDALRRVGCVREAVEAAVAAPAAVSVPQPPEKGADGEVAAAAKPKN